MYILRSINQYINNNNNNNNKDIINDFERSSYVNMHILIIRFDIVKNRARI